MNKIVKNSLLYFILTIIAVFCLGPFLWLLFTSLLPGQNIFSFHYDITLKSFSLKNYIDMWKFLNMPKYIMNTVIITGFTVVLSVFFSCLTAYPLVMFNFRGKNVIFIAMIATMIIPAASENIVNYLTIKKMGLLDSYAGVILPTIVSVFDVFLMRQAYLTVPVELRDAGRIDGASELRIWWQLVLPVVKPAVAVVAIFDFMGTWNNFLWPIIVLNDSGKFPLAAALTYLKGNFGYNFGWLGAGTVLSIIPIVAVFIAFQKYFIEGIAGALKF